MSYKNADVVKVKEIVVNSKSLKEVFRKLNKSCSGDACKALRNFCDKNEIDISHFVKYNSQDRQAISDIKILEATKDAFSAADVLKKLDLNYNSINLDWLKKKAILLNIENSWFGLDNRKGKKLPWFDKKEALDNILNNTTICSSSKLKEKLYSAGLLKPICSNCNLSSWLDKPISLQIDHINGNSKDNRLENLRILCPNCHSQTETFCRGTKAKTVKEKFVCIDCGREASAMEALRCRSCFRKNVKTKIEWPSVEVITEKLKNIPMTQLAKELGVSDNAIRKFLRRNK